MRAKEMRRNMTPAEHRLWQQSRANQFLSFHFRRQQVIDGFSADFYCHGAALVVEVDGSWHEPGYDQERDAIPAARGICVLRFTNDDVLHRMDSVLERMRHFLEKMT